MSKKVLRVAAPLALSFLAPGIGTALGGALGATGATAGVLGNSLLGAGVGALGGGGLKGALLGGLTGGASSALGSSGILGTAAGTPLKNALGPTQGSGVLGAATRTTSALTSPLSGVLGGGTSSFGGLGNLASNVYSGISTSKATDKARDQLLQAQGRAANEITPFTQTGQQANSRLAQLLGLDPNADQASVQNALAQTPGYQFELSEGQKAMDRLNAARGGVFSGAALREAGEFGQGLANRNYQQAIGNLQQQSGQGLQASSGLANILTGMGGTQAEATVAKNNAINQSLSNIFNPTQDLVYDPTTGQFKVRGA